MNKISEAKKNYFYLINVAQYFTPLVKKKVKNELAHIEIKIINTEVTVKVVFNGLGQSSIIFSVRNFEEEFNNNFSKNKQAFKREFKKILIDEIKKYLQEYKKSLLIQLKEQKKRKREQKEKNKEREAKRKKKIKSIPRIPYGIMNDE
jgi:small-conductance mechanosensitive channel